MLRGISWSQFLEWQAFETLEPFGEERDDYRAASIVQALWNIARDTKQNPNGWPLTDFLLSFGDAPSRRVQQTLATQELLVDSWIDGHNAVVLAKK